MRQLVAAGTALRQRKGGSSGGRSGGQGAAGCEGGSLASQKVGARLGGRALGGGSDRHAVDGVNARKLGRW